MEGDKGGGDGSCLFVGVSTGEVDGEGLAGESSTIALSLSAPVNASKALIQKFGGGGLGGASFFGSFPYAKQDSTNVEPPSPYPPHEYSVARKTQSHRCSRSDCLQPQVSG